MKVLRDFPRAHFQQTPFSPSSKTVRVLNLDWSASLGVHQERFMCLPACFCVSALMALRSLAAAVAYGPCTFGHGLPFFWICFPVWVLVSILPWYLSSICPWYDLPPYWSPGVSWPLLVCTVLLGSGWVLMWNFGSHETLMFDSHLPLKGKGPGAGGSFEGSSFESCINLCWSLLGWYLTECGSLGTDPLGRIRALVTLCLCLGSAGSGASANTSFFQRCLNGCLIFS